MDFNFFDFFDLFVGFNSEKEPYANVVNYRDNASIISEDMQKLIHRFIEAGLIVSSRDESHDEILSFVYDGFFKHWPELQTWVDESLVYLVWRNEIAKNFKKWQKSKLSLVVPEYSPKKRLEMFLEGFKDGWEGILNPKPDYLIRGLSKIVKGYEYTIFRRNEIISRYLKESLLESIKVPSLIFIMLICLLIDKYWIGS